MTDVYQSTSTTVLGKVNAHNSELVLHPLHPQYIHTYTCMYARVHTRTHTHKHIHTHTHSCTRAHTHTLHPVQSSPTHPLCIQFKAPPPYPMGSGDSLVVRAPDLWSKGRGFESLLGRRENFLFQGQLSMLTLISVSVPPPCYRSST